MIKKLSSFVEKHRTPMFLRRILPRRIGQKLKLLKTRILENSFQEKGSAYPSIHLTKEQIERGEYMKHIGGEENEWEERGEFQFKLLKALGLQKNDSVLDYGCGPIRAGRYFIRFLNDRGYAGVDYNESFIEASKYIVSKDASLFNKNPFLDWFPNFDLEKLKTKFDFILLFSVLNHCSLEQRKTFFREIISAMKKNSKLIITHAHWFNENYLEKTLYVSKKISHIKEIENLLGGPIEGWKGIDGLDTPKLMLPIILLSKK